MMTTRDRLEGDRNRMKKNKDTVDEEIHEEDCIVSELLPDIPNDVTLQLISTKLPWTTLHTLSSVSPAWKTAIQSHQTYAARARSHSTETLVVFNHTLSDGTLRIALYSLKDKAFYENLPPIPGVTSGIPEWCECATLDGRIYILGGLKTFSSLRGSKNVYVLDLAGQRQWEKCASMNSPRHDFGSGVIDEKIYVCGGSSCRAPVFETEVYDPKVDAWITVTPMPFGRTGHEVGIVEGELLVYGGGFFRGHFDPNRYRSKAKWTPPSEAFKAGNHFLSEWRLIDLVDYVEVYNPKEDKWRTLPQDVVDGSSGRLFVAKGRLHSIIESETFVFDFETNSWSGVHSILSTTGLGRDGPRYWPNSIYAMQAVDDQVLLIGKSWSLEVSLYILQKRAMHLDEETRLSDGTYFWLRAENRFRFGGFTPFLRGVQL